ncbi:MAG: FKBP-type peptidyl-prolyl cis-trans isomerase [Bacteroidales bacterium]|nr:FKBP-type peptidyl-prolyl cis-trans isomerase [Bacteroidales bacterium]
MSQSEKEVKIIEQYLKENKIKVKPQESGLYYIETEEGTGEQAEKGDNVVVHYSGRLLDGTKFDASYDRGEPFEFLLGAGRVIKGWDEGIALMKVGGKATLIIPSNLGYGSRAVGGVIPANSTLIFDVELIEVK